MYYNMKNFFYTLFFFTFTFIPLCRAENVLNERCLPFIEKPKVTIVAEYDALKYDHTKVAKTLLRMHKKEYGGNIDNGYEIHGLATYDLGTTLDFSLTKKTFNDGVTCFYPTNINLIVGIKNPTIYISRSLKKGTCAYEVALRHEQTHQQINIEVLEQYLPKIKENLIKAVKKYAVTARPKDDVSFELLQQGLQKKYLEAIDPVIQEIEQEIKQEQMYLDNAENYDFEQSLCI